MNALRPRLLACGLALGLVLLLTGCGSAKHPYDATAENNGFYVKLGTISYQLQISRELNQYAAEDHEYLVGLPAGTNSPGPNEIWYGVFLWAINDSKHPATAVDPNSIDITDTSNNVYHPVTLNPSVNEFAWTPETLPAHGTEPSQDSTASFGATQGGLLLFKLPTSVYANRPLTLQLHGSGHVATISLDL